MITAAPPIPNRADPSTFADRADAYVSWWSTVAAEINALTVALSSFGAGTVTGGTANALLVTTVIDFDSIGVGQQIVFSPTAPNLAGAITVNVDGTGAVSVLSPSLVSSLPAGYFETGVPMRLIKRASDYIAERRIQAGSNGNGRFTKWSDGTMICWHALSGSTGGAVQWDFPQSFAETPQVFATGGSPTVGVTAMTHNTNSNKTDFDVRNVSDARTSATCRLMAMGRWFI